MVEGTLSSLARFQTWLRAKCAELRINAPEKFNASTPMCDIAGHDEWSSLGLIAKAEEDFNINSSIYPVIVQCDEVSVWTFFEIIRWACGIRGQTIGYA